MAPHHSVFRPTLFGIARLIARIKALRISLGQSLDSAFAPSSFRAQPTGTKSLRRARRRFGQELCFEALEERRVLAGNTNVFLDGFGNLRVQDVSGKADTLSVRLINNTVYLEDPTNTLIAGPGVTQIANTLAAVPFTSIAHQILIFTEAGTDLVTVDFGGGNPIPSDGLFYDGGTGVNGLTLGNGAFQSSVFAQPDADHGTVQLERNVSGASVTSLISYNTKTNVTSTNTSNSIQLKYTGGSESINLSNSGSDRTTSQSIVGGVPSGIITVKNPSNALEVLATNGTDTINVSSFSSSSGLTIEGDDVSDLVNINGIVSVGGPGFTIADVGTVDLALASSDVLVTGTGIASITALRNIRLVTGSSIITNSGNLTLSANQQTPTTAGAFIGVSMAGLLQSTTGLVTVHGQAGIGSGTNAIGTRVFGSSARITSGGDVLVTGKGGGSTTGGVSFGIEIATGAQVSASGNGNVTVTGRGGSGSGGENDGIRLAYDNSVIASNDGNITVSGVGGGTDSGSFNTGVLVISGGQIKSSGHGNVSVTGQGGNGSDGSNGGLVVFDTGAAITSSDGNVLITGIEGVGSNSPGIWVSQNGTISATNLGNVTLLGNSMTLDSTAVVSASPTKSVLLRGRFSSMPINLGGSDNSSSLGLTDSELDRISAGSVQIGDVTSGTITVNAALTHHNHLSLVTASGINVSQSMTMAADKDLSLLSSSTTVGVSLSSNSNIVTSGTGGVSMTAARSIFVASNASVITDAGNLTLSANQQVPKTAGNFYGVDIAGLLQSNTGALIVKGHAGLESSANNAGVRVFSVNAQFASGGNITVEGTGGSGTGYLDGVQLVSGQIKATGNAMVTVQGQAGAAAINSSYGIYIASSSTISSGDGNLFVTGTGGGGSTGNQNYGIQVVAGSQISAMGSGNVTVVGQGGMGTGGTNYGVDVRDLGSAITSVGGDVSITGIEGGGSNSPGIQIVNSASIRTTASGGDITMIGNSIKLDATAIVSTTANDSVTLKPRTSVTQINLGGSDTSGMLGLTDAELDRITAGTVQIGDADSGSIAVSAALSHPNHLSLTSGGAIDIQQSIMMATAKNLTVTATSSNGAIALSTTTSDILAGSGSLTLSTAGALTLQSGASIGTADGAVHLNVDKIIVDATAAVTAVSGTVKVSPWTSSRLTNLGSTTDVAANTLELSDAELDRLFGSVQIGEIGSGAIIVSAALTPTDNLSLVASEGIDVQQSIAMAANKNLTVESVGMTAGITLSQPTSDISASGAGNVLLTAVRNIRLSSGSSAVTEAGSLALTANQQTPATNGSFVGVSIASGTVQSGTGALTIQGKGGSDSSTRNIGVEVAGSGSLITSLGGNVAVTGSGNGSGNFSFGVAITTGAQVSAGGTGSVSVLGNGSNTGGLQFGTYITGSGSRITSSGGDVMVTGTGGSGTGSFNYGVYVENGGEITAGNTGDVTVTGTGGNGSGGNNRGVFLSGASSEITSGGGSVSLVGFEGAGSNSLALWLASNAAVSTTALGGDISLIGNSVNLEATAVVSASPSNTVMLKPRTAVTLINLGGSDTSGMLGLTDAELDRITAGTVLIGDTNSGSITVSAGLSHSNNLSLISGGAIDVQQSLTTAAAKNLTVSAASANGTISLSTTTADIVAAAAASHCPPPELLSCRAVPASVRPAVT